MQSADFMVDSKISVLEAMCGDVTVLEATITLIIYNILTRN